MYFRAGVMSVIFLGGGIAMAIKHDWVLAGILILMAIFGLWLLTASGRPDRWG